MNISIHALREEGDKMEFQVYAIKDISIHALREEGDPSPVWQDATTEVFLSTPSARRATPRKHRARQTV